MKGAPCDCKKDAPCPCKFNKGCEFKKEMQAKKEEFEKRLALTDEQKAKLDSLHEKQMKKMRAIDIKIRKYEEKIGDLKREKMHVKFDGIAEFEKTLTDEQKAELQKSGSCSRPFVVQIDQAADECQDRHGGDRRVADRAQDVVDGFRCHALLLLVWLVWFYRSYRTYWSYFLSWNISITIRTITAARIASPAH